MSRFIWYPGYDVLLRDIVRAENCSLFDSDGRRYVDLEAGVWCTSIGHGNPRVLRAIAEQSARIAHTGFCYTSEIVEEVAKEILSLLGFEGGRCVFLCSGSEAVEYGVRVAQSIDDRPLLMIMADSYCGAYGSARRKHPGEWFSFDWTECASCPHSGGCGEHCERWAAIPWDRIAGFLLEPGSSSGLVRFPPEKLIRGIAAVMNDTNGLLLVNEVTTGVGRTGEWFGYQHYGVSPDIVAMGKGIGNGYPVSVTAMAPAVVNRLGDEPVNYAQSHQNDPLGAAVVREVIKTIREEKLVERGRDLAAALLGGLERIRAESGMIREIRARGLLVALELEDDPDGAFADRVHRELARRGFVLARRPHTSVLRVDPSLTIEKEDIEGFLKTLAAVLAQESA